MRKILGTAVLGLAALAATAQYVGPGVSSDIPAFHASVPARAASLTPVMSGTQLSGPYFAHPYQVAAYKMAAQVPGVLYQQPCYCRCDREMGHGSLHSCFESTHGAGCSTCMKEAVYAFRETRRGRSAAQVRAGIERGAWMNVDLENVR